MSATWTPTDTQRAEQIWATYQQAHDTSALTGQTAGIDPASERVWIGESAQDVVQKMQADGVDHPLYFVRIGYDYYERKGGRSIN
jgi:hypothetical protein